MIYYFCELNDLDNNRWFTGSGKVFYLYFKSKCLSIECYNCDKYKLVPCLRDDAYLPVALFVHLKLACWGSGNSSVESSEDTWITEKLELSGHKVN